MNTFDHKVIETKWRKKWEDNKIYKTPKLSKDDKKYYSLYSFPYPSGAGLHVGHVEGMVANDILARFKRMNGYKVTLPMGWDSFGLPAENYAIKTGIHPQKSTDDVIEVFRDQIKKVGISVDWDTEVAAHSPEYYKWTQWIFLQLYKNGLAYQKKAPVNWCPSCLTVLANEQVVEGKCERCDSEVIQKDMKQWFYKITDYAERLNNDLDKVDWPESTKAQQRNWIGKSEGIEITYLAGKYQKLLIGTSNKEKIKRIQKFILDNLPNIVLVTPEELGLEKLQIKENGKNLVENAKIKAIEYSKHTDLPVLSIDSGLESSEIDLHFETKSQALLNYSKAVGRTDEYQFTDEEIADAIIEYYTKLINDAGGKVEAQMSDHLVIAQNGKLLDHKNAIRKIVLYDQKSSIVDINVPLNSLYRPKVLENINDKFGSELDQLEKDLFLQPLYNAFEKLLSISITVFTTRPDTNFGATFIVMAPDSTFVKENLELLPNKDEVVKYIEQTTKKTELERISETKNKTGVFTGLYAINKLNNEKLPVYVGDFVLAKVGTGAVVGVPGHDLRDFQFAKAMNIPIKRVVVAKDGDSSDIITEDQVQEEEGNMINSDFLDGLDIFEAKEKMKDYLEEKGWGKRVINYRLRDWLLSRQRYWGCPIPIIYDPEGNPHPVPESDLPVLLPHDVDFKPTGESPLVYSKEFHKSAEEKYGKGWKREVDTMDTFVDSSWYYFRHLDSKNNEEFVNKELANSWLPTDLYMIGAEHIVLHLLYSRFFTKFFYDQGYINFDEPFYRMRHMGLILGPDGRKMSKRWGNIINPLDKIEKYGADSLRIYEMFMGPLFDAKPWNDKAEAGVYRFLHKIWQLQFKVKISNIPNKQDIEINKLIKKITEDIEVLSFNTIVAKFMEFSNYLKTENEISLDVWKKFILLLAPFVPFISEELWSKIDDNDIQSVHEQKWPTFDISKIKEENVIIAIQINGKFRDSIAIKFDSSEDEVKSAINKSQSKALKYINYESLIQVIYIKNKVINFIHR
jgi:leucyl-tRNA synthetase